jgi:glycosyltransferase involved in cell wall biosynthesis
MKVAICVVVRNEEKILYEWIAFHLALGFDTIFVIDDHSTDLTSEIARKAAVTHDVRLLQWLEHGKGKQGIAYTRVIERFRNEFDWIAFVDVDEFLVPTKAYTIQELLIGRPPQVALAIPWLMFGSSGHEQKPSGMVLEDYSHRAPFSFAPNFHIKSIVQPYTVLKGINPHYFEITGNYILEDSTTVEWAKNPSTKEPIFGLLSKEPPYSQWRLHHYFTRSKSHWVDRLARGQLGAITRTMEDFDRYDRNEIPDLTASRFLPKIRENIRRIELSAVEPSQANISLMPDFGDIMQPAMSPTEIALLKAILRCSSNHVEFGSGGSTVVASQLVSGSIVSIESSSEWVERVTAACRRIGGLEPTILLANIGPIKELGYPRGAEHRHLWNQYHTSVWDRYPLIGDTYLVDGRFRVACFLQILLHCHSNALILVHDFAGRPEYHVVRGFASEIARVDQLSVFQKRVDLDEAAVRSCFNDYAFDPR